MAGGQVDDEEDVELEEDGDSEEDGVDDEAGHAEGPAQHEPGGQQDDVEQHQAEKEGDDRVGQALGVHLDQPGVRGGAADNQSLKTHKQRKVDFSIDYLSIRSPTERIPILDLSNLSIDVTVLGT